MLAGIAGGQQGRAPTHRRARTPTSLQARRPQAGRQLAGWASAPLSPCGAKDAQYGVKELAQTAHVAGTALQQGDGQGHGQGHAHNHKGVPAAQAGV